MTTKAAWVTAVGAPLQVREAPMPRASGGEVVVRVRAVGINPIDWIVRSAAPVMYPWLKRPSVIGSDVAGEVVAVGETVTRVAVGDRVLGLAVGTDRDVNRAAEGAFQEHVVLRERLTTPIPNSMAFEDAAVLPLGIATAASALFQDAGLDLRLPKEDPGARMDAGADAPSETVLVWGAGTSVGMNAVQLAAAAGYRVIATASPDSRDRVLALGASSVVDYRNPDAVQQVLALLDGTRLAGTTAIGEGSGAPCVAIAARAAGTKRVAFLSAPVSFTTIARTGHLWRHLPPLMTRMVARNTVLRLRPAGAGVRARFVWGTSLRNTVVGPAIFAEFLPSALADGSYVPAPPALVVAEGLAGLETGLRRQLDGVKGQKVVVTL